MSLRRECPQCRGDRARALWHDGAMRYVRCSRCGTVYSDVERERYESEQHNVWDDAGLGADTVAFYRTARERVHQQFLAGLPPSGNGRLLDVGCGLGYFVERALERGWDAYGCDTATAWVQQAQGRLGVDRIRLGAPTASIFGGEGFDLITAWDVLEHVHDPLPFLRALTGLIAPGGTVFIRTPNLAWILPTYWLRRHLLREQIELGPLNHVVYYTSRTLTAALAEAGLEPAAWPVFVPPQVGFANRDPSQAGRRSKVTIAKNAHARVAGALARFSGGRVVVGADLDVLARRSSPEGVRTEAYRATSERMLAR